MNVDGLKTPFSITMGCVGSRHHATLDAKSVCKLAGPTVLVMEVYAGEIKWNGAHVFSGVSENQLVGKTLLELFALDKDDEIRRVSVFTHELNHARYRFRWEVYFPNIYVGVCLSELDRMEEDQVSVQKYTALMGAHRTKYLEHIPPHMFEPFRLLVMLADSMSKRLGDTTSQDVLVDVVNAVRSQEKNPIVTQSLSNVNQISTELYSRVRDLYDPEVVKFVVDTSNVDDQAMYVLDRRSIATVLYNLLNNAFKFTPDNGTVRLTVQRIESRSFRHVMKFTVEDSGPGLPDDVVMDLFSEEDDKPARGLRTFVRTRSATQILSDPYANMGIGLLTSVHLLRSMQSRLECSVSELDGSRLHFTLHLTPFQPDGGRVSMELAPRVHNLQEDCPVTIVCSDEVRTNDLVGTLHTFGFKKVTVLQTGESCIRQAVDCRDEDPEIIMVDYTTDMSSASLLMILGEILHHTTCFMMSDKPDKDDPTVIDRTSLQSVASVLTNYFETRDERSP